MKKAKLVVHGNKQEEQMHFDKTYAPTLSLNSLRIFVALTAEKRWVTS
jgi:Reverse transcriptase (RNA-dependent DNA polymerase)